MQKLERHLIARDNFVYLFIIFLLLFFCPFPHFHYHWNILGFPLAPLVFWISNGYIFILHIHRQMSVISNGSDVVKKNWPLKGEASRPSASKEKAIFHCPSHLILILIRTHHSHREREREGEREGGFFYTDLFDFNSRPKKNLSQMASRIVQQQQARGIMLLNPCIFLSVCFLFLSKYWVFCCLIFWCVVSSFALKVGSWGFWFGFFCKWMKIRKLVFWIQNLFE